MEKEEQNNVVTQTTEKETEKTEGTVTQTVNKTEEKEEKTFTQEEVNAMIAKEKNKMPTKEEMKAFKEWQESQKTAEQKQSEKEIKYQETLSKNTELANENKVLKAGVNVDDTDYVLFKVSKMEGEFEENLQKLLEENPKYLKQEKNDGDRTEIKLGGSHEKEAQITQEEFNKMGYQSRVKLYNENKELYNKLAKK